ncbi:neurosecretory protein VGF [Trichomycterus rosablanca]|uniref:neurosecretory protein VGF n=1 Tax=Trichomycterus rosablanca TaxID=2290929 RepID=UPI002F35412B
MIRSRQPSRAPVVLLIIFFSLTIKTTKSSPLTGNIEGDQYGPPSSELKQAQFQSTQTINDQQVPSNEEEEELFEDIDPKTLAAVLLKAINKPQEEVISKEDKSREMKHKEEEEREIQGADRDRDGHQELEMIMATAEAQGRGEREDDEERKREEEEEERLTEKVTSHTTSQTIPVKVQEVVTKEVVNKEGQQEERGTDQDNEEQINSEELKNLETMLEEFQSYSTTRKRERDSSFSERESRGDYFDFLDRNGLMNNEIKPKPKGYDLAEPKKKLKWQQELEKDKNRPLSKGGNFMDDNLEDQQQDNGEEDEELLSPEEEEARAKAEQEEVRRQAAEAQRAKAEEEKLADIASDMILQYMVKQDGKKYKDNNAAEDKRSEEEGTNDDDLDPQTIDKLIEISSKLHLPADDVVDIISDVEKKKKKDAPENLQWQRPLIVPSAPAVPSTSSRTTPSSKPPKPNTTPLKTWFMERASIKPNKQDFWIKQQQPFWTYPSYRFYQKPYSPYYPIYMPPPKPKQRYFAKPSFSLNEILGNSLDYDFNYPLKQKYRPWTKTRSRAPPIYWRNLYYPNYIVPPPRTFQAAPMPKPWSALRQRPAYYYSPPASVVTRQEDYYNQVQQPQHASDEGLDNFIEKVLLKHPRMFQ